GPVEEEVKARVYNLDLRFKTLDDAPFVASWLLRSPSGEVYRSRAETDRLRVDLIPAGECNLTVYGVGNVTLFSKIFQAEELHGVRELKLPIKTVKARVLWSDGSPIDGARVELVGRGLRYNGTADLDGVLRFKNLVLGSYQVKVFYPYTSVLIFDKKLEFDGGDVKLVVKAARLSVKVVDWLDRPLSGAEVSVGCGPVLLGRAVTGGDGVAEFSKVPLLRIYEVKARFGSLESKALARPGEIPVLKMRLINLFGFIVDVDAVMAALPYIIAVVVVIILAVAIVVIRSMTRRRVV
ncbi:MAG: carboxypeptidase regulatory-like domain-containing protein, partial [Thaumarchaeota archaeon]|nr:carboxypeptidase regulatory-like domain-containing protein [Nitrososphaerota archaeon]